MDAGLHNMDCMKAIKGIPDNHYDFAIVDPPYGIRESCKDFSSRDRPVTDKRRNSTQRKSIVKSKRYTRKNWDKEKPSKKYFIELQRISKNQIIFGGNYFLDYLGKTNCFLVWDKDNGESDFSDCELAWTNFKTSTRKIKYRWDGMLQENMKNKEKRIHPTQKPVGLYRWILSKYTNKGDRIVDTHAGSCSLWIACIEEGCSYTGFEIDKEYYNAAIDRVNKYMGSYTPSFF